MTCGKLLAPGQWWHFCGETDMGQTLPVKCTACGGEYKLDSPEVQAEDAPMTECKHRWEGIDFPYRHPTHYMYRCARCSAYTFTFLKEKQA
jgi:DNA-directed RNA polymerase subunit RPC12/RpoP